MERGGFDCVLGNPPYLFLTGKGSPVSAALKSNNAALAHEWAARIECASSLMPGASNGCKDLYKWFVYRAAQVAGRDKCSIGLILPNSYLSLPRYGETKCTLTSAGIASVVDFGFGAFPGLTVATNATTCITGGSEGFLYYHDLSDAFSVAMPPSEMQSVLHKEKRLIGLRNGNFSLYRIPETERFFDSSRITIANIASIYEGDHDIVIPSQGETSQSGVSCVIDAKMRFFGAAPIGKAWNIVPLTERHKGVRVLIRKTGDRIYAGIAIEDGVAHQNVYVANALKGVSPYALLGLLCSKSVSFLYRGCPLGQKGRPMAQLRLSGIESIPVPDEFLAYQADIDELTKRIIEEPSCTLYAELNSLIYSIYGFTESDIVLAEEVCSDISP